MTKATPDQLFAQEARLVAGASLIPATIAGAMTYIVGEGKGAEHLEVMVPLVSVLTWVVSFLLLSRADNVKRG